MEINNLYQNYIQRNCTLEYTINEMDKMLGGITAVFYTPQKLTIQNHLKRVSLKNPNRGRATIKNTQKFALAVYIKAQQNGSKFPGELHFSKKASTNDHMLGIKRILN